MNLSYLLDSDLRDLGFTLVEIDDHFLELRLDGSPVAHFSTMGVTLEALLADARSLADDMAKPEKSGTTVGLTAERGRV
jgi:hypothetical protein